MKKFKIAIISLIIFGVSLVGGMSLYLIYSSYKSLPDVSKLVEDYDPITPSVIYDSKGNIIDKIFTENREVVDIDDVPKHLKNAVLAIEDRRFMDHFGFDIIRFTKSVITAPIYIIRGRNVHGGSTLTQQLSRNAFLNHDRKLTRKIKELIIAIEIERRYTKDEILEKYLNVIYFNHGAYGIQTASKTFFDKSVENLNIAESALLVGVPNRPGAYSPMKNLPNAIRRKNIIISQMLKYGFITEKEYEEAKNHQFIYEDEASEEQKDNPHVTLVKKAVEQRRGDIAPEFVDLVRREVESKFTEKEIYEGGLQIYTTLDLDMQKEAERALRESAIFKADEKMNGALVTIDSHTGYVLNMVGGREYKSGDFNRSTMSVRQPGSAFKPFVYFTALDMGYPMNMVVEDSSINYDDWKPNNYGGVFRNNVTAFESIERSINISSIKIMQRVGIKNVIQRARQAGFESDIPFDLTASLGTMVTTPLELATSYAPFSNGGYRVKPIYITKIKDKYGKTVLENKVAKEKVFEVESVAQINYMLQDVVELGSGRRAQAYYTNSLGKKLKVPQGGKTGTTNEWRSAWYSGFTPDMVTTIYVGYDDNSSLAGKQTGGTAAAPIWGDLYQSILDKDVYSPSEKFEFVDDLIKDKTLVKEVLDSRNGLLVDKGSYISRAMLLPREKLPVEYGDKYRNGIRSFFDETLIKEMKEEYEEVQEEIENEENIMQDERNREIDDILNELFGD